MTSTEILEIHDHGGGFDKNLYHSIIDNAVKSGHTHISTEYIFDQRILDMYPDTTFYLLYDLKKKILNHFDYYNQHPELKFNKFLCSFNGSDHVGRKLLVAILNKMNWFSVGSCTKNFQFTVDTLDGHLRDFVPTEHRFYRKFFIGHNSSDFFNTIYTDGSNNSKYIQFDHASNIVLLENIITDCFVNLVCECIPTAYYPFYSEKFLYSIVTRGLFVSYAQPFWHNHLEKFYGFKKYNKIFDYQYDQIINPVERLVELISMLSKFSTLSKSDWSDLYEMEKETIEFNYDHYYSGNYLTRMQQYQ